MVLFEVFFGIPSDVQSIPSGLSFGLSSRFSSRLPSEVPSELPLGLPSGFPLEFPSRVRSKISGLPLWFPCLPFYHAFGITSEVPSGLPMEILRDCSFGVSFRSSFRGFLRDSFFHCCEMTFSEFSLFFRDPFRGSILSFSLDSVF